MIGKNVPNEWAPKSQFEDDDDDDEEDAERVPPISEEKDNEYLK
jgi:hypothetical protein